MFRAVMSLLLFIPKGVTTVLLQSCLPVKQRRGSHSPSCQVHTCIGMQTHTHAHTCTHSFRGRTVFPLNSFDELEGRSRRTEHWPLPSSVGKFGPRGSERVSLTEQTSSADAKLSLLMW